MHMAVESSNAQKIQGGQGFLRRLQVVLFALSSTVLSSSISHSYVTSPGALPVQRQREWLKQMTDVLVNDVKPGHISNNQVDEAHALICAWSQVGHTSRSLNRKADDVLVLESLIKRLVDECRATGTDEALVTVEDYNYLLEGWARSGLGVAAAERCELILQLMQEQGPLPNLSSFKAVLQAWRQPPTADYNALRMQRILEWMIRLYQNKSNANSLPDADCFDTVLQTWSRSGIDDAPMKVEQLLVTMERLYESTSNQQVKPRTLSFNAVLAAWSKRVENGDATAADRANDILGFMELLESRGDETAAPDCCSYCTVAAAYSKTDDQLKAAAKSETLLKRLEMRYYDSIWNESNSSFLPDTILYNTCMGIWLKSRTPGAFRRARSLLDRQLALHETSQYNSRCMPDVYGYTTVISSCAAESGNKKEKAKAFEVAVCTFQQLEQASNLHLDGDGPNHVTYGAMLKACARLIPPGARRSEWARVIFDKSKEAGCVNDMAVRYLRKAVSPPVYRNLMEGQNPKKLPLEWTENLPENETSVASRRMRKSTSNTGKRRRAEV